MEATFKPEFVNRLDEIVEFDSLTREEIGEIVELQVEKLIHRVRERGVEVELTDKAKELIGNLGYDPTYGARPLKRVIQKQLVDKLALKLLEGEFGPGDTVTRGRGRWRARFRQGRKRGGARHGLVAQAVDCERAVGPESRSASASPGPRASPPLGASRVRNVVSESKAAEVTVALASFVWLPLITEPGSELRADSRQLAFPPVS